MMATSISHLSRRCAATVAALALVMGSVAAAQVVNATPSSAALPTAKERLAGSDRFQTSVKVSQNTYPDPAAVSTVVIANGMNFPDALSAAALAGVKDAPLLLTFANSLPASVTAEVNRLQPSKIIIAGGSGVVSPGIAAALENMSFGPEIVRLAGANRYATAAAVAAYGWPSGSTKVFLATGKNFADALAAAPVAASQNAPLLLVDSGAVAQTAVAGAAPQLNAAEVVVAGGTGAISNAVANTVAGYSGASVTRKSGSDRYKTARAFADELNGSATLYIANGMSFPDALAGAAAAGAQNAPLMLSPKQCLSDDAVALADSMQNLNRYRVLGGVGALSQNVYDGVSCTTAGNYIRMVEIKMHQKINAYRASNNLPPLQRYSGLDSVAGTNTTIMVNTGMIGHHNPNLMGDVGQVANQAGYFAYSAGENAALICYLVGMDADADAQKMVTGWINSTGHRANILDSDFNATGFRAQFDSSGNCIFATNVFGQFS